MEYIITHAGKWISWNTLLSNNRWQRAKIIAEWKAVYSTMFRVAQIQPMQRYAIEFRYWSKIDADNVCMKYFIDALRNEGYVVNDDKRYLAGVTTIPDPTLKHNTYVIKLRVIS
jgi:hypothetical protein